MFCSNCQAEYAPGFTRCSDCDIDLVQDLPLAAHPAKPRRIPPAPPDVSAYMSRSDRPGPLTRYAILWFLGLPLVAYLVLELADVRLWGTASVATGLAALLVYWAVGRRQDLAARLALRLVVVALVTAGYAVALLLLLNSSHGGVLGPEARRFLALALVAGLLVQALLSPNAALRRLAQPLIRWRAPWRVYAVAILAWPLITVLVIELSRHLPGAQSEVAQGSFIWSTLRLGTLHALTAGPWAVAWFGYGVPVLLRRRSALTTSLVLGVLTWLQLAIPWFVHGRFGRPDLYLYLGTGLALAVVAVWLFQRARGSVWPVLLLEATTATFLLLNWSGDGFGSGDYSSWTALVAAEAILAAALVVLGRMWVRPQDVSVQPHPEEPGPAEGQRRTLVEEHY